MKHSQKSASCMVSHQQGSHPWYHCKSCHRQCQWRHKGSRQIQKTWFVLKQGFVCRLCRQLVLKEGAEKNYIKNQPSVMNAPYFLFFLFLSASNSSDSVIILSLFTLLSSDFPMPSFCLMASIFRYDSLWLILWGILILRPLDFWWLILWVIPIFSSWLLQTMTHS